MRIRVKEIEPRVYGAIFYDGINFDDVKRFIEETELEVLIKCDRGPGLPTIYIEGIGKISPRTYIVRFGGKEIKCYSKEEFDKHFGIYDENENIEDGFEDYLALSYVKAKLNPITNKYTVVNKTTGFQFEIDKDVFESKYIYIKDFNRFL